MFLVGGLAVGVGLASLVLGYQDGRTDVLRSLPSIVIGGIVIRMAARRRTGERKRKDVR
jgi:hypothetical protein